MEYQVLRENLLIRLKNILNEHAVKLWLPPFYENENTNLDSLQELAMKYHKMMNTDQESCIEMLLELQSVSLCRLEERKNLKTQGLATIHVRISGKQLPEFPIQIRLGDLVNDFRELIAQKIEVSKERLKLISKGKVLLPERTLEVENVKHGCTIMVVVLATEVEKDALEKTNNNQALLDETRNDIECLMNGHSEKYLNITNQLGASLNLPPEEKRALVVAMALHEKGRRAFLRKEYALALVFFLEADTEFKYCRSDILDKVDNYALVNLDIVWTYLHLRSLCCLNDAEERLKLCEQVFLRTYGANMERLENIKGSSGNESVLLVRLRLLQGILYYLVNRQREAQEKFNEVENQIQILKIDKKNVKALCDLGYYAKEARIALRATFNDLNAVVDYIHRQRQEKESIRKHEKLRKFADRHKCMNGDLINLTVLDQLHNMGYTRLLGVSALRHSNNCINDALMWIQNFLSPLYTLYPTDIVDEVKQLEFDDPNVSPILKRHNYELDDACICDLFSIYGVELGAGPSSSTNRPIDSNQENPSTSNSSPADENEPEEKISKKEHNADSGEPSTSNNSHADQNKLKNEQLKKEQHAALNRLHDTISNDVDDYLDINLESEEKFLLHYKSLLP